jgi:hypothetical protein
MLGLVSCFIVNVDISTLNVRERLELDLEFLGDIVGSTQGLVSFHDDVDFDEETGTRGVCAHSINGGDEWRMGHCCGDKLAQKALKSGDGIEVQM